MLTVTMDTNPYPINNQLPGNTSLLGNNQLPGNSQLPRNTPLPGEDHRPVSVNVTILSKNFSRNVKIISALATVTVISAIFYYCLKPNESNYIQHVKECMKGFNIPGCKNGVYCPNEDPTFVGIAATCVNEIDSVIFEGSKKSMEYRLQKYLESRNIFEKVYDAVYDKIFL